MPVQAAFDLARSEGPAVVLVWLSMLSDAIQNKTWQTSRTVAEIAADTGLTRNTITRAQARLTEAGYATALAGGGRTRRKTTFAMTPLANFSGKPAELPDSKPSKPIGNW